MANELDLTKSLDIASRIRTPVAVLAISAVLLTAIALAGIYKLQQEEYIIRFLMITLFVLAILVVGVSIAIIRSANKSSTEIEKIIPTRRAVGEQKTFMSAPMATVPKDKRDASKSDFIEITNVLREKAQQLEVFWGGTQVPPSGDWNNPAEALAQTVERIRDSDNFILILPDFACSPQENVCKPSSIWWEVGMAIAMKKPCSFFVHKNIAEDPKNKLPYYLGAIENAKDRPVLPRMKIRKFDRLKDIIDRIEEDGHEIFPIL